MEQGYKQFSIWVSMVCIHTELSSAFGNYKFSRETKQREMIPPGEYGQAAPSRS